MIASLKSTLFNFSNKVNSNQRYKTIRRDLNTIKGFQLKEFIVSTDDKTIIAVDKSHHKLVIMQMNGETQHHNLMHCSDLMSVHMYENGTAVKSYTNSFLLNKIPEHKPISTADEQTSFLKIQTTIKDIESIKFHFKPMRESDDITEWFDICRQLIGRAERSIETINSRIQISG